MMNKNQSDKSRWLIVFSGFLVLACAAWRWSLRHKPETTPLTEPMAIYGHLNGQPALLRCNASWYSSPEHGRLTASGEIFDSTQLTAAIYRPFLRHAGGWGARLLVRNSINGRCVVVRITDAMPSRYAKSGRMLDLSRAAAESLGMVRAGVVPVEVWKTKQPLCGRKEKNGRR